MRMSMISEFFMKWVRATSKYVEVRLIEKEGMTNTATHVNSDAIPRGVLIIKFPF